MQKTGIKYTYQALIIITKLIAISFTAFQVYTAIHVPLVATLQRSTHLLFATLLVFLLPQKSSSEDKELPRLMDIVFALAGLVSMLYIILEFDQLPFRRGVPNNSDVVMGILAVIVVLEGTRRTLGIAMPLVAVSIFFYVFLGNYLPGRFGHIGYDIERVSSFLYMTNEGIFGIPVGVAATVVAVFIIFGVLLQKSGASEFLIKLSMALLGHVRGGPAKVSVVASSMFGTISGSIVANVVGTGAFTIPVMKRTGFSAEFAGAVEATASTGGMITPPIMGTVAFLIAEIVGVPYWTVIVTAAIPALLYYTALFFAIDCRAGILGMKGLPRKELPAVRSVLREGWIFIIPMGVLIYLLGVVKFTATKSGIWGCGAIFLIAVFQGRVNLRWIIDVLIESGKGFVTVAMAMACAGIIIGGFTLTGLGLKMSSLLIQVSGGELLTLLFLTMFSCLILGMGMTCTAAYIILAVLVAPALVDMGVPILAAHFFVFHYGSLANITPPVALGSYAAAGIAKGNPIKTGWRSLQIALPGLIVPFLFVYNPALIMQGKVDAILGGTATAMVGVYMMAIATQGYFLGRIPPLSRLIAFLIGGLLVIPELRTDIVGLVFCAMFCTAHWVRSKRKS
jgi:TRAP transporter 4TM/12TM fusion protein